MSTTADLSANKKSGNKKKTQRREEGLEASIHSPQRELTKFEQLIAASPPLISPAADEPDKNLTRTATGKGTPEMLPKASKPDKMKPGTESNKVSSPPRTWQQCLDEVERLKDKPTPYGTFADLCSQILRANTSPQKPFTAAGTPDSKANEPSAVGDSAPVPKKAAKAKHTSTVDGPPHTAKTTIKPRLELDESELYKTAEDTASRLTSEPVHALATEPTKAASAPESKSKVFNNAVTEAALPKLASNSKSKVTDSPPAMVDLSPAVNPSPIADPVYPVRPAEAIKDLPTPSIRKRFDQAPTYGDSAFAILVGPDPDRKTFWMHEALARSESVYIDDVCRGHYLRDDDEDLVIEFPGYEPEHFQLFFLFVYRRSIFSTRTGDNADGTVDLEWNRLVKSWALGDHLEASDFKDAVADAIVHKLNTTVRPFPPMLHRVIYMNTVDGSLLRRMVADIVAWRWYTPMLFAAKRDGAWRGSEQWRDFFIDVALVLNGMKIEGRSGKPPYEQEGCVYHEHSATCTPCYKSKSTRL